VHRQYNARPIRPTDGREQRRLASIRRRHAPRADTPDDASIPIDIFDDIEI
jgi:hypothetical protein